MDLFENIKNGNIPDENIIFFLLDNKIENNDPEIDRYIEIIKKSLLNSELTTEKVLLIRVLFVLENYRDKDLAIKNFILRTLKIPATETHDYIAIFKKFIVKIEFSTTFELLNKNILQLSTQSEKDLRNFFAWCLHVIWNIKEFYNHSNWVMLYSNLKILISELIKQEKISSVMYVEFFTYHIMGNNFQTIDEWREFNKNITQKTESLYKKYASTLQKANPTKKNKKRIAFIKDRVVMNSVFQTEYSLFKLLKNDKTFNDNYEIAVYTVNYFEKSQDFDKCINMFEQIGVPYINPVIKFLKDGYYNNHYQKALQLRQTLLDDDIDIIIMGGVFPIIDFLYLSRTAPLQIYFSHGNCAFNIEGIDKRITHFRQECNEFECNLINIPITNEFLIGTAGEKEIGELLKKDYLEKYGKDTVILGTIGRLVKIDSDEYLETLSIIMKQYPNTIYLACGIGNRETIKTKLKKYNIDEKRFLFLGQINAHIYGWVIDLYLAPFPADSGQALEEFRRKGKPYVAMHSYTEWYLKFKEDFNQRPDSFIDRELYNEEELKRTLLNQPLIPENRYSFTFQTISHVLNKEDYLQVALRFLKDSELIRKSVIENQYFYKQQKYDIKPFLKVLND